MNGPLLLKMTDAAKFLGLSKTEFFQQIRRGNIPQGALPPGSKRGRVWHVDQLRTVADRWVRS